MSMNKKRDRAARPQRTAAQHRQLMLWNILAALTIILFLLLVYVGYMLLQPPEVTLGGKPIRNLEILDGMETMPYPKDEFGTEIVMLQHLIPWYEENPNLVGWLRIEDTKIDYPVVHTPENEKEYLYKNFNGKYSTEGTLILGAVCTTDPESDNQIIYGHNMKRGTMFHDLMNYQIKAYWEEHPIIEYSTLYEERQYEIIAAYYDVIYDKNADVFKFYQFANYETEAEFDDAMRYFQSRSVYDTGVEPVYGDKLLTLVTCSYHTTNGRFVVVAREKTEQPADTTAPTE